LHAVLSVTVVDTHNVGGLMTEPKDRSELIFDSRVSCAMFPFGEKRTLKQKAFAFESEPLGGIRPAENRFRLKNLFGSTRLLRDVFAFCEAAPAHAATPQ
jgi:hypothetical protein